MKKIPSDLDALMWTVAEGGDLAAIDDFERRFPQFKGELGTRMAMVRGLKQSKPPVREASPIPRFVARERTSQPAQRRRVFTVAALGGLAMVAFAAYAVVANLPKPEPLPAPKSGIVAPQVEPEPEDSLSGNRDRERETIKPTNPPVVMPWDTRKSVTINDAALEDVLKLIAETCSLKIELAPGMPKPIVSVRYQDKTGLEMLKDLGRQYGFTPLEQEPGEVLIIPAVEFSPPR